ELVLTTETDTGELALRRVHLDADEMTAYHYHRDRNEIVFVQNGIVEIRLEDDYVEVEAGEAHVIEAGETHQIQNIDDQVVGLLEVGFPFDPDDVVMVEDPYEASR
ncbi:MAG: cupin domain-containing protein, partial [Candidatus Nanohaloarchaea archaeon]|nr:cupin domain-containing protein [Candidatus Nanohaloarchaea archaeon]